MRCIIKGKALYHHDYAIGLTANDLLAIEGNIYRI